MNPREPDPDQQDGFDVQVVDGRTDAPIDEDWLADQGRDEDSLS